MTVTIEQLDARVKALESKVFETPPATSATIIAFKADEDEFNLVKSIGGNWITTSRWPGGGLNETSVSAGAAGLKIIPRYQLEKQGDKTALKPLRTPEEITTATGKAEFDAAAYKRAKVEWVAIGNEPDAANQRFWTGKLAEFGPTYAVHIAPIFRRNFKIIWELPQVNVNNIPEFVFGLVDSGAYHAGDKFSFHAYQSTAEKHVARFLEAMAKTRTIIPALANSDFCSLEWSIARGGPDSEKLVEEKKLHAQMTELGLWLLAKYRIRRNKWGESFMSPFDELNRPTFTHPFWKSVLM